MLFMLLLQIQHILLYLISIINIFLSLTFMLIQTILRSLYKAINFNPFQIIHRSDYLRVFCFSFLFPLQFLTTLLFFSSSCWW